MSAAFHPPVEPTTEIRSMLPSDLEAVAAIERSAYGYPWSPGIFRDCLLAGYHCLVLEANHTVTGYGIMSVASSEAHVLNLCVHPESQGMGFGRRLLGELLMQAEEAKTEKVFLEVRPSNRPALRLYRSMGFQQVGIRPAYYQARRGREDAVILALTLRPPHR